MIYTRFGSPVTLVSKDGPWVTCRYETGEIKEWAETEFRADGGWDELEKALAAIPEIKKSKKASK